MDFDEDDFGMDRRGGDHLNRQSSAISASICNVDVCQGNQMDSSPYPSNSMVGSFSAGLWNQPTTSQGSRFRQASTRSSSNGDPTQKPVSIPWRLDAGAGFSQAGPGFRPPSFCHFPSNPTFVERAAMLSCFDGGGGGYGGSEIPLRTPSSDSSSKGVQVQSNKRKRNTHAQLEMELDHVEGAQQSSAKQKTKISSEKQAKDVSDATNEDYVHVRARRGQATNSHSLAERVRREKISERMKFLQELVPGCSKITGKAVMLDEIINYVQSLQRQVEFLSMKLAAVNPRIDFNLEALLSKDFLQPRGGPSSISFLPEMTHPQLHLPQQGFIQSGVPGITHPLEALRRAMSTQLTIMSGYKESAPQMPDTWNDELQNVIQMNFGASGPSLNTEELNDKPRDGFPI